MIAVEAAKAAGERILKGYEETLLIQNKSAAADLVTNIDNESEQIIRGELIGHFPKYGFLGEETEKVEELEKEYCWIVDPLDGTANFVYGLK